jgi:subtilase family serine protease
VPEKRVQSRITQEVDDTRLVTLGSNTHPLARPEFDRGPAPADLPLERMLLVLKRSPTQESALKQLLDQQQDRFSPNYHKWLTPEEFGQQFGPSLQDIQVITSWLESQGFQVAGVSHGRTAIEFSGTAGQVQNAFRAAIHQFVVNGEEHWANANDPQIPTALTPVVAGVSTLHNFRKKPQIRISPQAIPATYDAASGRPAFTARDGSHGLAPADYAVIYNINPLYQAGVNGTGTSIAIVAKSNIRLQDITDFRNLFKLPTNAPQIILNGRDPGLVRSRGAQCHRQARCFG